MGGTIGTLSFLRKPWGLRGSLGVGPGSVEVQKHQDSCGQAQKWLPTFLFLEIDGTFLSAKSAHRFLFPRNRWCFSPNSKCHQYTRSIVNLISSSKLARQVLRYRRVEQSQRMAQAPVPRVQRASCPEHPMPSLRSNRYR